MPKDSSLSTSRSRICFEMAVILSGQRIVDSSGEESTMVGKRQHAPAEEGGIVGSVSA
jgi:hypothetical protein